MAKLHIQVKNNNTFIIRTSRDAIWDFIVIHKYDLAKHGGLVNVLRYKLKMLSNIGAEGTKSYAIVHNILAAVELFR